MGAHRTIYDRASGMTRAPIVSVVLTCHNLGQYLGEALASVEAQTFKDFEIVVVDDGSTEPLTLRVLDALDVARIRLIRSERRGLSGARNLGLASTRGRYLCFLDADDLLEPSCLEKSVAELERDPAISFVSHWLTAFGDEHWEWRPERCDLPALLDVNTVNGAALVRRQAVVEVGGFDESMQRGCEDWELWIRMVERGHQGVILKEMLFRYRRRPDSMSRSMRGEVRLGLYRELIERHTEAFRQHLVTLAARRAADVDRLALESDALEYEHEQRLRPRRDRLRDELRALLRRAERDQTRRTGAAYLEAARALAVADAAALRASLSWRVTAPLRAGLSLLLRLRRWA